VSRRSRLQLLGLLSPGAVAAPTLRPVLERGAWRFIAGMAIDTDGAPKAYALPGSGLIGLDSIANAYRPAEPTKNISAKYFGLACDGMGKPYIQGPGDPAPGYAVSQTALRDTHRPVKDPRSYVDASEVPYIVAPPELLSRGVKLGDLAAVKRDKYVAHAIVADVGPHGHYGEASPACARLLDVDDNPRTGGCPRGVTYIIYPGSRSMPAWPRDRVEFQAAAAKLYAAWETN
jgi:hypothetical protein